VRATGTGGLDHGPGKFPIAAACSSRRHHHGRHVNSATAGSPTRPPAATASRPAHPTDRARLRTPPLWVGHGAGRRAAGRWPPVMVFGGTRDGRHGSGYAPRGTPSPRNGRRHRSTSFRPRHDRWTITGRTVWSTRPVRALTSLLWSSPHPLLSLNRFTAAGVLEIDRRRVDSELLAIRLPLPFGDRGRSNAARGR
jgi:hypothetical protein